MTADQPAELSKKVIKIVFVSKVKAVELKVAGQQAIQNIE